MDRADSTHDDQRAAKAGRSTAFNTLYSLVFWPYLLLSCVVLFCVALAIFLLTFPFDRKRRVLHRFTCLWAAHYLAWAPFASVKVEGKEHVRNVGACVYVSNHQSMVDILAVFATHLDFLWVSKIENFYAPFLGWNMVLNGYVAVKRGYLPSILRMVRTCHDKLASGYSLFLFPEGTRSPDGTMQKFHRGAFYLANKFRVPVVPIVLEGTNAVLKKHSALVNPGPVLVRVLEPVYPKDVGFDEQRLTALVRERMQAAQRAIRDG
jgi:1-acyl-sn-glycerol-3-phosphate acyltransferase